MFHAPQLPNSGKTTRETYNMLEGLKWNMGIDLAFDEYVSKIRITFLPTYYGPSRVYRRVRGVLVLIP